MDAHARKERRKSMSLDKCTRACGSEGKRQRCKGGERKRKKGRRGYPPPPYEGRRRGREGEKIFSPLLAHGCTCEKREEKEVNELTQVHARVLE